MRLPLKYYIRLPLNILYAITIKHILCDCHKKYNMRLPLNLYYAIAIKHIVCD